MGWRDRFLDVRENLEDRAGVSVVPRERLVLLETSDAERRALQKELDLLAYTALDYVGNNPQEIKVVERRKLVQRSRVTWMRDPQAGAAVDLMNDFVFGRGIPKPKANDAQVQEVIDEAWEDPDNQLVLTSYQAQMALGTDLSLQSNLFLLVFEDGEDGKVKLGLLDHDTVETVVRDPDNRLRILYYVAKVVRQKWDFEHDRPEQMQYMPGQGTNAQSSTINGLSNSPGQVKYYEHWRNVEDLAEEIKDGARQEDDTELCPEEKLADGKVFHVALNRTSEMAFGHPVMDRVLRWYNAYNAFMDARVDIMAASAAFVMKRKVKGTPHQLQKMATQALSRRSVLASARDPEMNMDVGPRAGGIITENDSVTHEDFNINTNAPAAAQDAQMIRAQISSATRFPQSYYGDASNSNLSTATSLELPVLKAVEARQEVFEAIIRFFTDRVIERAVEAGRIDETLSAEEKAAAQQTEDDAWSAPDQPVNVEPGDPTVATQEGYEGQGDDEEDTQRDLGYEFSMPSPLRRMMGDLVLAVMNVAKTFDPNNTNIELSRTLLSICLGEALEMEDPGAAVEKIFPPGYKDPAVVAAQQAQQQATQPAPGAPGSQFGEFSPDAASGGFSGADGNQGSAGNPYGAPQSSPPPEQAMEARFGDLPSDLKNRTMARIAEIDRIFDEEILEIVGASSNGKGE